MPQTKDEIIRARVTDQEFSAALQAATLLDITISDLMRRALAAYLEHLADADARKITPETEAEWQRVRKEAVG